MTPGRLAAVTAVLLVALVGPSATAAGASLKVSLSTAKPVTNERLHVIVDGTTDVPDPDPSRDEFSVSIYFDRGATSTGACAPTAAAEDARITPGADNHIGASGGIFGPPPPDTVGPGSFHFIEDEVFMDSARYVMCGYLVRRQRPTDADPQLRESTVAASALPFIVAANPRLRPGRPGARGRALARRLGFRRCRELHRGNPRALGHCFNQVIRRYPF